MRGRMDTDAALGERGLQWCRGGPAGTMELASEGCPGALARLSVKPTVNGESVADVAALDDSGTTRWLSPDADIAQTLIPLEREWVIKVVITARRECVLGGGLTVDLAPGLDDCSLFMPTHWAFLGKVADFASYRNFYPRYTTRDGFKAQLRTPAVCVWNGDVGITVAALRPKPVTIDVANVDGVIRFSIPFDRPAYGPDRCIPNPALAAGETLEYAVYLCPHTGDWRTGMQQWMDYAKANTIRDDFPLIRWPSEMKMMLAKWTVKVDRLEIDRMAELGVTCLEVLPWTAPSRDVIDYAHAKGIKVLMEYMMFSYYEVGPEDNIDEYDCPLPELVGPRHREILEEHPDWAVIKADGERAGTGLSGSGWMYMDPAVKAFREAKVREAVNVVKQGYDGVRYDNGIIFDCYSTEHEHDMTFAEAGNLMLREIMAGIRAVNPEAVVMINNAGPDLLSIADAFMNEGGLSRNDFLYEQIDTAKAAGVSDYPQTCLRYHTLECIWGMMGKPTCTHDYAEHRKKPWTYYTDDHKRKIHRSVIFNVMHGAITCFGGANGFREKEYVIASTIYRLAQQPLTDVTHQDGLVYQAFAPGCILILETAKAQFNGAIEIPDDIVAAMDGVCHPVEVVAADGTVCACGKRPGAVAIHVHLEPDGYEVLRLGRGTSA